MNSMLSQVRKHPISPPQSESYGSSPSTISDSFPRSFSQPMTMNSPMPSEPFSVWPPTPRNSVTRTSGPETHYPQYSLPEHPSGHISNATSWGSPPSSEDRDQPERDGSSIPPTHHQYGSHIEDNWERPRADYHNPMMSSMDRHESTSSYNSTPSSGYLSLPSYPYPSQSHDLKLNTDVEPSRIPDEFQNSEVPPPSSYYFDERHSSEGSSYMTDYTHSANRTPLTLSSASTPLSPMVRSLSRSRESTSPSRSYRVSPYAPSDRKRWSAPGDVSGLFNPSLDPQLQGPQIHSHHSSPVCPPTLPPYMPSHSNSAYMPSYVDHHEVPPHMMQNSYCIPSQCRTDHHTSHYGDCVDRPDLYSSIKEEHTPPPPEDMNPENPDMKPHEQDVRFDGDMYTPRWVRGQGNKREGWCGICKPGRWLVLKNSAFWYDKSFSHGISAATGQTFHEPRDMRRMDGNSDVWEGLCHSCNDWVPLVSNKKKGTTWFRHAYKCHTHTKVRDAPKRRRECSSGNNNNGMVATATGPMAAVPSAPPSIHPHSHLHSHVKSDMKTSYPY